MKDKILKDWATQKDADIDFLQIFTSDEICKEGFYMPKDFFRGFVIVDHNFYYIYHKNKVVSH